MQTLPESHQTCKVAAAQTSGPVNLVFFCLSCLFECEHSFIDKPMVITEPAVASRGLLGYILATGHACSTKILLHSCRVFLEYSKIK